jgi:hypothetical protein
VQEKVFDCVVRFSVSLVPGSIKAVF